MICTLKKSKEFDILYKKGSKRHNEFFILFFLNQKGYKAGFTVSKKVGCAVIRNKVRRQLKEIYRKYIPFMQEGTLVFVAKAAITQKSFCDIEKAFITSINHMGIWRKV